jgi:hypothetical protein
VEADRADRQDRHRNGKSDPLDAISAARAAQSGRAAGVSKGRDGAVEANRTLMVAKRSARHERTRANCQARALILTGPDELRARFAGHRAAALAAWIAALRPRPGDAAEYSLPVALRELGRRVEFLDAQIERLDDLITPLVTAPPPAAQPLRRRPRYRRPAADRRRGQPAAAAQRGHLGAPVRRRPDPRLLGQDPPPLAQPRRQLRGQPRPVAHRHHPDGLAPGHPRLRRAAHRRGLVEEGDHPLQPRGRHWADHDGCLMPARPRLMAVCQDGGTAAGKRSTRK